MITYAEPEEPVDTTAFVPPALPRPVLRRTSHAQECEPAQHQQIINEIRRQFGYLVVTNLTRQVATG